jgi:hypothetical protein
MFIFGGSVKYLSIALSLLFLIGCNVESQGHKIPQEAEDASLIYDSSISQATSKRKPATIKQQSYAKPSSCLQLTGSDMLVDAVNHTNAIEFGTKEIILGIPTLEQETEKVLKEVNPFYVSASVYRKFESIQVVDWYKDIIKTGGRHTVVYNASCEDCDRSTHLNAPLIFYITSTNHSPFKDSNGKVYFEKSCHLSKRVRMSIRTLSGEVIENRFFKPNIGSISAYAIDATDGKKFSFSIQTFIQNKQAIDLIDQEVFIDVCEVTSSEICKQGDPGFISSTKRKILRENLKDHNLGLLLGLGRMYKLSR